MDDKITFDKLVRWIIALLIILGLLYFINRLSGALIPFFLAIFLAYYLNPLVLFFQRVFKIKKRGIAIFLSFLSLTIGFGAVFSILTPLLVNEIVGLEPLISKFMASESMKSLEGLPSVVEDYIIEIKDSAQIKEMLSGLDYQSILNNILDQSSAILGGSLSLLMGLFSLFTLILYLVFILADYSEFSQTWSDLIPIKFREKSIQLVSDFQMGMDSYFKAQAMVALIVGILFAIGFSIIGLPMAILFGLFVGALNMVPYLQIFGLLPGAFLALMYAVDSGNSFLYCFGLVLLVFAIVQVIQDSILVPRIMGTVTSLNPAIILLSLSIWGSLLGIIGMLIAIPVTNLIVSYYKSFIKKEDTAHANELTN